MAAGTVLAIFLFLRELVPRTPWAWTVGALMVAFQPMFAFIGAGVQGDNLLYLASALTFLDARPRLAARPDDAPRRRDRRRARRSGCSRSSPSSRSSPAPGSRSRCSPGARAAPGARRGAARCSPPASASPPRRSLLYALLNVTVWNRGSALAGGAAPASTSRGGPGPTRDHAGTRSSTTPGSCYLPRLPFMNHVYFPGHVPAVADLARRVDRPLRLARLHLPGLGVRRLPATSSTCSPRSARSGSGACAARSAPLAGLLVSFAVMGARPDRGDRLPRRHAHLDGRPRFPQARYLFPLLALYALAIVLATKALPRRWAPVLGALLVALAMAHNLFAETLTISRYYG